MNIIANTVQLALVGGVMLVGARHALADDCDPNNGDYDCNDGLFCNGYERCLLVGDPGYDAEYLCVDGAPPNCIDGYACTFDYCSEERQ